MTSREGTHSRSVVVLTLLSWEFQAIRQMGRAWTMRATGNSLVVTKIAASELAQMPSILQWLTFAVAIIVAYISFNQYRIARDKLRLELFDKRYKVFEGARLMISKVLQNGSLSVAELREFQMSMIDYRFLFGPEVGTYLELVGKKAVSFHTYTEVARTAHGGERAEAVGKSHAALAWLSAELLESRVTEKFGPYLQFVSDVRPPSWIRLRVDRFRKNLKERLASRVAPT